jgi:origin recognition complex subunit 1
VSKSQQMKRKAQPKVVKEEEDVMEIDLEEGTSSYATRPAAKPSSKQKVPKQKPVVLQRPSLSPPPTQYVSSSESNDDATSDFDDEEKDEDSEDDSESNTSVGSFEMSDQSNSEDSVSEESDTPVTPSRARRKRKSTQTTPRKARRTVTAPTPHSKAALRKRKQSQLMLKSRSLIQRPSGRSQTLPDDPLARALQVLHVGARPDVLPCRDEEYTDVLSAVLGLLEEGSGGCVCMLLLEMTICLF